MKVSIVMMFTTFNLILAACSYGDIPAGKAGAVFAVHCYTVGEHALQGQAGVISVEPGWSGSRWRIFYAGPGPIARRLR